MIIYLYWSCDDLERQHRDLETLANAGTKTNNYETFYVDFLWRDKRISELLSRRNAEENGAMGHLDSEDDRSGSVR